jgi:hypothetical protein
LHKYLGNIHNPFEDNSEDIRNILKIIMIDKKVCDSIVLSNKKTLLFGLNNLLDIRIDASLKNLPNARCHRIT